MSPRLPLASPPRRWLAIGALISAANGCDCNKPLPIIETGPAHRGQPLVWVVDDGERIRQGGGSSPLMKGNAIWSPDVGVDLFGLRDETVAIQVVVSAGDAPLTDVSIEVADLAHCGATTEAFVVHELPMKRRSAGKNPRESLGWTAAATPPSVAPGGQLADALIPTNNAPTWADYPMSIPAASQRVVWLDVHISASAPAGKCPSRIEIRAGTESIGKIPLNLTVASQQLPYRSTKTMVYFDPRELTNRYGDERAVNEYHQLLHAHHLSAVVPLRSAADVERHSSMLDGSLFNPKAGYAGPGQGVGADIAVIGAYGSMGKPTPASLSAALNTLTALGRHGVTEPKSDIFLYAVDEQCDSPLGPDWRAALTAAGPPLAQLKVGHTCSTPPAAQPVDVVMVFAPEYDTTTAATATQHGKTVWIYNGVLPHTGSFLTDSWPLSLRANAWIQARYNIPRWFYWESTFWNDNNRGGQGPYDPLATAETFHNADGDHCNGDGVLAYPGTQTNDGMRSLGSLSTFPSIRMKQWRRGISDVGYLQLARKVDKSAADAILHKIVPAALQHARGMSAPPFSVVGKDYLEARRALFDLLRKAPATP